MFPCGDTFAEVKETLLVLRRILALLAVVGLWSGFFVAEAAAAPQAAKAKPSPVDADLLLEGGLIVDGSGGKPYRGDVAIRGDRIVAVGRFPVGKVKRQIDCRNLVVTPGYIDLHNHSDYSILEKPSNQAANYLTQGCTTIVTGNCGSGQWQVARYLEQLEKQGAGVNVVHLLPHGTIRARVMGSVRREANAEELTRMGKLIEQGMQEGAWGMSTGLIYVPGAYADTNELVYLACIVARYGGIYASHIRNESATLLDAVEEALEIGRRAQLPVHISHFKVMGRPYWGSVRIAAHRIEQARRHGLRVTADQYPYIASSTSLSAMLLPSAMREGGTRALQRRLRDPAQREKARLLITQALKLRDRIQIAGYDPHPEWAGKTLRQIARELKRTPEDVALEIFLNGDAAAVNFGMSEQDVRWVMQLPWVATASDGKARVPAKAKPHPRSYGTFSRKIGYYCLREKVLPLQQAVRSSSGLPADILGLTDRGYLRPGYAADVVVFDPRRFIDRATFEEPYKTSVGVKLVLVNGQVAVQDDRPTGALAGRPLRHPVPQGAKVQAGGQ